jgi:hypothetical protein
MVKRETVCVPDDGQNRIQGWDSVNWDGDFPY